MATATVRRALGAAHPWPDPGADPFGVYSAVGHLQVTGYAQGTGSAETSMRLSVPDGADVLAVPLATGVNGPATTTDSEAGVVITLAPVDGGTPATTYATDVMDTFLGGRYLLAYGDASPFRGRDVDVTVTLLQPDACAGAACTHDVDLYVGPAWFEQIPDLCTSEADGTHLRYDYPDDPSPTAVASCGAPQPYRFVEVAMSVDQPFDRYGAGADRYVAEVTLPERFGLVDFGLTYGPRLESMTVNSRPVPVDMIHDAFPIRRATYNRVVDSARWTFCNRDAAAMDRYFRPGVNTIEVVVAAANDWDERPFSLYARFAVSDPAAPDQPVERDDSGPVGSEPAESHPAAVEAPAGPDGGGGKGEIPWVPLLGGLALLLAAAVLGLRRARR